MCTVMQTTFDDVIAMYIPLTVLYNARSEDKERKLK